MVVVGVLHALRVAALKAQQSAARLAGFAMATFEGVVESHDGWIVDCNEQFAQMLGRTVAELKGVAIADLIAPEDRERVAANIRENRESVMEHAALRMDGTRIVVESHGRPAAPNSPHRYTAIRDITERRLAQESLHKAHAELETRVGERTAELNRAMRTVEAEQQRFQEVLDQLPAYVVLLSPDYQVPFANQFFEERFGKSEGRRCYEYLFQRTEPCENCETYKVLKTGAPHRWEWIGPDGRNYDIHDFPFIDVDGSPLIMEVGLDITERKQAEAALRLANAYNRSLIEASLDPLVTIGLDGKITDVNAATEAATGCSRAELIGTDFCDYFTEPEKARAGYEQVFREGSVRDYALELRHRNGHVTSVLYNASVYRDEAGKTVGVFAAARDITERKRAEAAVRVERQRFLDVLETLPVIVTLFRPDHRVEWVNRAYREALGDNVGQLCYASQFGRDKPCQECQAFTPLKTGQPHNWEWTLPNGRTFDIYNFPFADADGSPLILEMDIDITERRRAEAALKEANERLEQRVVERTAALAESEEKLSLALRSADMGVWRLDLREQKRYFDGQVCQCLGIDPADFRGTAEEFYAAVHPDDRQGIERALAQTITSGALYETEYRAIRSDGSFRYITARGQLARDTAGQPQWIDGLVWDITQSKRAEAEIARLNQDLQRRVAELHTIFDTVPIGLAIAEDTEGHHIRGNPANERLLGVRAGGELSKAGPRAAKYRCLHEGHELAVTELPVQRAIRGETVTGQVFDVVREDEQTITLYSSALPLFDEKGQPRGAVGAFMDITALKQAEKELREREQRIRASLAEKEVLLKEIHHRVKNNMQVISSLVALQADRLQDASMREVLQDVTHRVRSMALVHEKLYQSADMARVDFAQYAESLLNYLWRAHGEAAACTRLALDLEPVPISINAAVPCGLILNELATNALKHAFRGRGRGEVAVSLRGGPEGRVCLSLRDNGTGLPEGFNWRKADSLGLRLVQILAEQLHATVEVTSGEGTEFSVSFGGTNT